LATTPPYSNSFLKENILQKHKHPNGKNGFLFFNKSLIPRARVITNNKCLPHCDVLLFPNKGKDPEASLRNFLPPPIQRMPQTKNAEPDHFDGDGMTKNMASHASHKVPSLFFFFGSTRV
jgi:hypothetical protein